MRIPPLALTVLSLVALFGPSRLFASNALDVIRAGLKCDGITDDTAALYAANATSKKLQIPANRVCALADQWIPLNGTDLGGSGGRSVILFTGSGKSAIYFADNNQIHIHDLSLRGKSDVKIAAIGINFGNSADSTVERVNVSLFWLVGIHLAGRNNKVLNSRVESCKFGIGGNGADKAEIRGNYVSNHYSTSGEARPWTPASNYWDGIAQEGLTNSLIKGNTSEDNGQSGIYTGGNGTASSGNRIIGNKAFHNGNNGIDQGVSGTVSATNHLRNIVITGNIATDNLNSEYWIACVQGAVVQFNKGYKTSRYESYWGTQANPNRHVFGAWEGCGKNSDDAVSNVKATRNTFIDENRAQASMFIDVKRGSGNVFKPNRNQLLCGQCLPGDARESKFVSSKEQRNREQNYQK